MTAVNQTISIDYYSDVLCIWAYIAQARVDEIKKQFGDQVEINYRVCKVFADVDYKMQTTWKVKVAMKALPSICMRWPGNTTTSSCTKISG